MKYDKFIKVAVGLIAVAIFFVVPSMASAALTAPTITSVAGDNVINNTEKTVTFQVVFNMSTGTTSTSWIMVNVANANHANSATTTLPLGTNATSTSINIINASSLADGSATVSLWWSDGYATSTVATQSVTVDATAPTLSAVAVSSNNASTSLAKVGNIVTLTFTSSETIATPTITIGTSTDVVGITHTSNAWTATTTMSSGDTNGNVPFTITFADSPAGNSGTEVTAITTGGNVRFDKTPPTISSVTWGDADGSTNINTGDTVTIVFSEAMATSTATTTSLGLSADTFGNSTLAWTAATTTLTITLGNSSTITSGDTINPTSATDLAGNTYSTLVWPITDSTGPLTPVASLAAGTYTSTQTTTLTSTGSTKIYYTVDGSTPTCSSNLYDGNFVVINHSLTLEAVGCDAYSNVTVTPLSVVYVISSGSSGGSSSGGGGYSGGYSYVPPVTSPVLPPIATIPTTPANHPSNGNGSVTVFANDLSFGSTGDDVVALQTYLETKGYLVMPEGVAKGYFGGRTREAVRKFQSDNGLPMVGRVGPLTRGILNQGQ